MGMFDSPRTIAYKKDFFEEYGNLFTEKQKDTLDWWLFSPNHLDGGLFISPNKMAEVIGVTGETTRRWCKEGKIKWVYVSCDGSRGVYAEEIVRIVKERDLTSHKPSDTMEE